jgi:hypothetical protein
MRTVKIMKRETVFKGEKKSKSIRNHESEERTTKKHREIERLHKVENILQP